LKLPNAEQCEVEEGKIKDYLLNTLHPVGRSKAQFFLGMGFRSDAWETLAEALRQHGRSGEVASSRETKFGTLYVVAGSLRSLTGIERDVCTVWHLDRGVVAPRLVTAYPRKG
jgi:hypothetical protein